MALTQAVCSALAYRRGRSAGSRAEIFAHWGSGLQDASHAGRSPGRHRSSDSEPLRDLTTEPEEEHALFNRLHSFGDGLAAKRGCEAEHALNDGEIFWIVEHVVHEGLIDLEDVDRKTLQIGERGVTGAEIIESEGDSQFAAGVNDLGDLRHVGQGGALEHFDLKP